MNVTEVSDLLAFAALYDNRKAAEPDILAWFRAIGDLPYADAEEAIVQHYGQSTERIMPGHIRIRVRAMRADRLARSIPPAPNPELADQPGRYLKAVQDGIQHIADGHSLQRAIAGPLEGEPPPEWQEAKAALRDSEGAPVDPRLKAREQVEESRRARQEREDRGEAS